MLPEPRSVFLGHRDGSPRHRPPVGSARAAWHRSRMPQPAYVVLGATGGIGSALCRRLTAPGARPTVAARDCRRTPHPGAGLGAPPPPIDAPPPPPVARCFAEAVEHHGRIDGVVNCVGSLVLKPAHLTTDDEWASALATNLTSAFLTVRAAVRAMTGTGGAVVLMSSAAARVGIANHEAVAAAKAGVLGLVLSAAASYAGRGIRLNAVPPGLVRTPLTAALTAEQGRVKGSAALQPAGRS